METKRCSKCGEEKPISEFNLNGRSPTNNYRRRPECRECQAEVDRMWRDKNKDHVRERGVENRRRIRDIPNAKCYLAKARKLLRGEIVDPHCERGD